MDLADQSALTFEEQQLWQLARTWRQPRWLAHPDQLDWSRIVSVAIDNRMASLLDGVLRDTGMMNSLSPSDSKALGDEATRLAGRAETYTDILGRYMAQAVRQDLVTVPMKGLWVSAKVYGNASMRPGHDLDILVPRHRIDDCVAIAERLGFGRYWPAQLDDVFYRRHHLHLELCLEDCWTWIEIHWAFDHPRTRLTIDYDAVFARATPGELLGIPVWELSLPDLLLYLSIHLVKHMIYLPAVLDRPDLRRVILADGRLMHFLDVAETVKVYERQIDWALLVRLAEAYGAVDILGSVLRVCRDTLDAPVPAEVIEALPVAPASRPIRRLMEAMVATKLAEYSGEASSAFWRFLVSQDETFIFRPIRLLDLLTYLLPGQDYLRRRYGAASLRTANSHLAYALADALRLALDSASYTWQRRKRPLPVFLTLPSEAAPET